MNNPTAHQSFAYKGSWDFLDKLLEEYKDFQRDPLSSRHAVNCAMTAWHIKDWIWHEYLDSDSSFLQRKDAMAPLVTKDADWVRYLISLCQELEIIQSITYGTKHFKPYKPFRKVQSTELHEGAFTREFTLGFDVSYLKIVLDDGTELAFELVISQIVAFWEGFFNKFLK